MKHQLQLLLLSLLLPILFLPILPSTTHAKSIIEPCSSSDSCNSLLSYLLPWDSKLSEIASRFQVNISDILAANSINPTPQLSSGNQILPVKSLVKVPISCPCANGIRQSLSTTYAVRAADSLDSISEGYGELVSAEQIKSVNGIGEKRVLMSGERIVIPLPCTCFSNSNNGVAAVYLSYVVQRGESLSRIGDEYGTTVNELEAVNELEQMVVDPGDILAIPIPACSSANLDWHNESLIVPNGSCALTANNCIKCSCGPTNLKLQCFPSGMDAFCSHLQCKGSDDLFIGDIIEKKTPFGCNVTECVYRGHNGSKIFRSLVNSSHVHCSGNRSYTADSPTTSPTSPNSLVPILTLSPSPSPSSSFNQTTRIDPFNPKTEQNSSISSSDGELLLGQASCFFLLLVELVHFFII